MKMTFTHFVICLRFSGIEEDYHNFVDSYSSEVLATILNQWAFDYVDYLKRDGCN